MGFAKKTRLNFQYLSTFSIIALIIMFCCLKDDYLQKFVEKKTFYKGLERIRDSNGSINVQSCDLFSGRWVYDNASHPSYNYTQCSFMFEEYACEKYGRKDLKYQKWRWQPHDCNIPRFNGTALLEKIRGKKIIFVGDSLNKNLWTSLLCLLESSISPSSSKSYIKDQNLLSYQDIEYNATIGFYWSPFLVESNNDDLVSHHIHNRVVRIEAIENHAVQWTDADILIFDSFAWWTEPKITLMWGEFGRSDAIYKKVEMKLRRYEMALNTWSDWLEFHINRTRTKMFFMSLSPTHHQWNEDWSMIRNCYNETEPIKNEKYWGINTDREMMKVAESAIQKLETRGLKIQYLNITQLSDYRKDGHPSIYKKFYHPLTEDELKDPRSYSDCLHWCLPGLPDLWNQILYVYLMNS